MQQRVSFLEQEKQELQASLEARMERADSIMEMIKKRNQEEIETI